MRSRHDGAADPAPERAGAFAAFGLLLEVDAGIDISDLGLVGAPRQPGLDGAPAEPPTRIRLDPEELERRWSSSSSAARRVRELREGNSVVLTVDLAEPAGYLLWAQEVGRVLITLDGMQLLCDPLPEAPGWGAILPAQALPLAATLRGLEVLHAAGVILGAGATLFAGPPGAGKSSLAAAFLRRGAKLLSEDVIALGRRDGSLVAHPGVGLIQLRPAEHERLSKDERGALGSPTPFAGKQRYAHETTSIPFPFGELFLLERATRGPAIEHVGEVDPFALLAATYNLSVRTPERLTRQLDVVESLAATGRIYRLRVLPDMDATRLAEIVEEHLAYVSR
jgi:hypothetical protein